MERWLSGRKRLPRKQLSRDKWDRGFESHSLLQRKFLAVRSTGTILTLGIVSLCWVAALSASVVDNRFFPLCTQGYFRKGDPIGTGDGNFFVMTGKEARNHRRDAVHMPEIYGKYDLSQVSHGLETVLGVNYVKPEWQAAKDLIATMEGKLQAPGLHLGCERRLYEALSIGIQLDLMHVSSRI